MSLLRCPVCHQPLEKEGNTYRCMSSHSFDAAKEGYVNLLLSHRKNSKQPGDNKEMLLSRRRFLQAGHFDRLIDHLSERVAQYSTDHNGCSILDLGCGEGYFLRSLEARLDIEAECWGIDVAKSAMQMAAKADKKNHYAVASNSDLPFLDKSFDIVFSINAPIFESELVRTMKDNGVYIRFAPAGRHLYELKKYIYEEPRPHDEAIPSFDSLVHSQREILDFDIQLSEGEAYDLLSMTPYYWHASAEAQEQVKGLSSLSSPASFSVDVYRKK